MTTRQPEALRLAEQYDHGDPAAHGNAWKAAVCTELRRQHARIAELEAEIAAVGAGGVQALSAAPADIAKLRHLYQNMVNGAVRDTASAKRIAEGLLAPAIEALERATPPAEQQATTTGAALEDVYAELPEPTASIGIDDAWHEPAMRGFADRTHAARLRCKSEQARLATLWGYVRADATTQQAAPKAAPVEPSDVEIDDFLDSPACITWVIASNRDRYRLLVRAVLAKWATPPAEQPATTKAAATTGAALGGVYAELPRAGAIGYVSVVDVDSYVTRMTIGPRLPGVRDIALWTTDQLRDFADRTHALRMEQASGGACNDLPRAVHY